MSIDLADRDWLATLVDEELARPVAGPDRLPVELRAGGGGRDLAPGARVLVARSLRHRRLGAAPAAPLEGFLEVARGHVALVLDLAALAGEPPLPPRRRVEVADFLAAAVGEPGLALDADATRGGGAPRPVERALRAAGRDLLARFYPPGDPVHGLPLYPGALAVLRRHLARIASSAYRVGRLDAEALARHRGFAQRELVLLVEATAGLLAAAGPEADEAARSVRRRQVVRLGLPGPESREARRAAAAPRPPGVLAAAAAERLRPFLLEQLLLAQLRTGLAGERAAAFIEAFAVGGGLDAATLVAAQIEAAAQHGDHLTWFHAVGGPAVGDWQALAEEWEATADDLVERVSRAVTDNVDAFATEIRETGELGQLLAKAASGRALSAEEKRKVKEQLIDLAKAVPALAIFAAPGGMLLLPLLAKLLPFNVLPGAWDRERHPPPARRR